MEDFQNEQEMALPGEELSKLFRSNPKTEGFEKSVVTFTRFFEMMQEAMFKHKKFRAVINYDAEKDRAAMYIYTPKGSCEYDKTQEDRET